MHTEARTSSLQVVLDRITRKWWLYLVLLLLFFIPSYASKGYAPSRSPDLVSEVLSAPLIHGVRALRPIAKLIPLALVASLFVFGNTMRRAFDGYLAALYIGLALLQNAALTATYGFVVILGNVALMLLVALSWLWEAVVPRNDYATLERRPLRWWVAPLALFALLEPIDVSSMSPDINPLRLLTNEAGLTYCMMTPVVLATLTLYYPRLNLATLRISSFAGLVFGAVNMITWFALQPWGWWMGVLHIPLVVISLYAFVLAHATGEIQSSGSTPARA